jgi:ribosome-associated translation inhibitor RaiA
MEIHWDGLQEIRQEQRDAIEARLRTLGEQHDDLMAIRVVGTPSAHHKHGGSEVHVHATLKGRELAASRSAPDLPAALHEAVDAFTHELRKLREKETHRRGETSRRIKPREEPRE